MCLKKNTVKKINTEICSQIPSKVRQIKNFNVSLLAKSILYENFVLAQMTQPNPMST